MPTSSADWAFPVTGSPIMRRLADAGFVTAARLRARRLDRLDLGRTQRRTLARLVRRGRNTRFGRDHQFADVRTVADFQARVPLRDYDDYWNQYWKASYPFLDDITWPGKFPYYALSSGTTTGSTKYIPISREMVKSNKRAAFTTMALFRNVFPRHRVFTGTFFYLGGCTDLRRQADGSLAGDLSGIANNEAHRLLRAYAFPPLDISLIPDWTVKLAKLAELGVKQDVTAISGVPSWILALFDRVKQVSGKRTISDVWPNLRVVIHGGTKFDSYRGTFRAEIGNDDVRFHEVYPCSEGFIATEDPRYGLLRVIPDHRIFYEFVPLEQFADGKLKTATPDRYTLDQVQLGVPYAVALTNCSGMWAYLVGDTVTFEKLNPPLIRFSGRTKNFLSAFGEHLIEEEVERAIAVASTACGVFTSDHHVGPVFPTDPSRPGHHHYLVEFRGPPPPDLARFAAVIDDHLRRTNEDYDAHRVDDLTMLAPRVTAVAEGQFGKWMEWRGKAGGANKVPRMDNTGVLTGELAEWLRTHG